MTATETKDVFTTGDVAKICRVAPRTVSKWFDSGKLRGYRIPGSRDRRIPFDSLLAFMRAHGIPMNGVNDGVCRVLLIGEASLQKIADTMNVTGQYDVRTAANCFEAGLVTHQFRPHVIVLNHATPADAEAFRACLDIKSSTSLQGTRIISAIGISIDSEKNEQPSGSFDACLVSPYTPSQLAKAIEEVTNLTD